MALTHHDSTYKCPHCNNSEKLSFKRETRITLIKPIPAGKTEIFEELSCLVCTKCNTAFNERELILNNPVKVAFSEVSKRNGK